MFNSNQQGQGQENKIMKGNENPEFPEPEPGNGSVLALAIPPEVSEKMFDDLGIHDKHSVRLVCSVWRKLVDKNRTVVYNIVLRDETADTVQNLDFNRFLNIGSFKVAGLTMIGFNFGKIVTTFPNVIFSKVIVGEGNSPYNFWNTLRFCVQKNVESLVLDKNAIPDAYEDSVSSMTTNANIPHAAMSSVRNLEITRKQFGRSAHAKKNMADFSQAFTMTSLENFQYKIVRSSRIYFSYSKPATTDEMLSEFYDFLTLHQSIKKLTLTISVEPDDKLFGWETLCKDSTPFPHGTILSIFNANANMFRLGRNLNEDPFRPIPLVPWPNIEKLRLNLDFKFYNEVHFLTGKWMGLKKVSIVQPKYLCGDNFSQSGFNHLTQILRHNRSTIESFSLQCHGINFSSLELHNCTQLKVLKLYSTYITNVPVQDSNNPSIAIQVRCLKIGTMDRGCQFNMIRRVLDLARKDLEELTVLFYREFLLEHLDWMLELPKIKKIVIAGLWAAEVEEALVNYCKKKPHKLCGAMLTPRKKDGRKDFVICISN